LSFPLATNERGTAFVNSMRSWVQYDLNKKRVLDVGCAYGGLSIAMASAGATVTGIDSNPKLIAYAEANAYGQTDVGLSVLDIATIAVRDQFPPQSFDFIVLNDTLERIYDSDAVISNIDYLLSDYGMVYFRVPNNNSTRYILSEARTKIFGLALVDPSCWFYYSKKRTPIFYRSLNIYLALFRFYNMTKRVLIDDDNVLGRITERRLSQQIKEIYTTARSANFPDSALVPIMRRETVKLRDRYIDDLEKRGEDYVKFKYGSTYFSGFITRAKASLTLHASTLELPEFGLVARLEDESKSREASSPSDQTARPLQITS
jgi:2-polyprenyl-3-methyl-5-hydroxy-6-metoxy-1,4-benzoquinol methylase